MTARGHRVPAARAGSDGRAPRALRSLAPGALALLGALGAGCRPASDDMARQPRFEELEPSAFFADGGAARHLPDGVVVRVGSHDGHVPRLGAAVAADGVPPGLDAAGLDDDRLVARGQERYGIWCTPCHDASGRGDGPVVQRGYPSPPSFLEPRLLAAPDAHLYRVVTDGLGKMPPYGPHVPPGDRRAIIAWVRVLQRAQVASLDDAPAQARAGLLAQTGETR